MSTAINGRLSRTGVPEAGAPDDRWKGPVLSIGVHQRLSEELVSRCDSRSVEIVRRPNRGTAVLHDRDLTYCVLPPALGRMGVLEAYRWVAEGLIDGLGRLGLTAEGQRRPLASIAWP